MVRTDYSDYASFNDNGTQRPTTNYLKALNDQAVAKYGEWGFDFLVVMIHSDNWRSYDGVRRIWGTNYSYIFGKQHLQYCRWDKRNAANTFGTAYHERHHALDALCMVDAGVNVNPILGVTNFDKQITHGESPDWDYIRHKENTKSVKKIAPFIRRALDKRLERHIAMNNKKRNVLIPLLEKAVYLLKMKLNQKTSIQK